ncbi:MAG: radical SAM/SPASM domain-containing protein [Bacteroidota bacterium]|nr:radical SAM/SPASM domain-containing protein [Bacteroidota bacterium]
MTKSIAQRVDEHTHIPKSKLVENPPFPDSIKIEITSRCNFNCSFCATNRGKRPQGDIDKKFLYRILKEAKSVGVKEIGMFLLGESFLVDELSEYIEYAKKEAEIDYVFITTNGSLCTPEVMKKVVESGLDSIKFSINAGSKERYKKIHGVDMFDSVIDNIKWLNNYRNENNFDFPRICISSIYMEKYKAELESFKKYVKDFSDEFYFLPLYNQAGHIGGKKYTRIVGNPGRLENMANPVPCWALFNASKITWDGKLTACCFDHDTRFEIADLNKVSLIEAWNHPKFVDLRKKHLTEDLKNSLCANCLGL